MQGSSAGIYNQQLDLQKHLPVLRISNGMWRLLLHVVRVPLHVLPPFPLPVHPCSLLLYIHGLFFSTVATYIHVYMCIYGLLNPFRAAHVCIRSGLISWDCISREWQKP